jgi:copper chaperone CopZ
MTAARVRLEGMTTAILDVVRLTCPFCITSVTDALAMDGVGYVDVRLEESAVAVAHDLRVDVDYLIVRLANAGFEARRRA